MIAVNHIYVFKVKQVANVTTKCNRASLLCPYCNKSTPISSCLYSRTCFQIKSKI